MNVKCPNCRFKFDAPALNANLGEEIECTCPRCGKPFATILQMDAPLQAKAEEPVYQQPVAQDASSEPQGSEVELYYAAMQCMEDGRDVEARELVTKLLQLNAHESLYIKFKERLDLADEKKRKEEERIKTLYFSAMKSIDSGQFDQAEDYIRSLLAVNPTEPMYLSLRDSLVEAKRQEAQRQEELRLKEEARRREEERKREEARMEEERRRQEALVEKCRQLLNGENIESLEMFGNLNSAQISETRTIVNEMPDAIKAKLMELPVQDLMAWIQKKPEEKRRWVAIEEEKIMTPEEKRRREEKEIYLKAVDYLNQGLNNTAQDYVDRLMEMDPNNPKYQELSKRIYGKTTSTDGSGSGCMVVVLALVISLAAILAL